VLADTSVSALAAGVIHMPVSRTIAAHNASIFFMVAISLENLPNPPCQSRK
jgi:hypothetical protein